MDDVRTPIEISALFGRVTSIHYVPEHFIPLRKLANPKLPLAEILARHPDGKSAGHIFDEARVDGNIISTDLIALEFAVQAHLALNQSVSINLSAETFFSNLLLQKVKELKATYPKFNPSSICLEITEQGGIPDTFNERYLMELKNMGFSLALDDFDPTIAFEHKRLAHYGAYVDIVKFPHQVMEIFRSGDVERADKVALQIQAVKTNYPHVTLVMEGVREADLKLIKKLNDLGIDLIQQTNHGSTEPMRPINQEAIALALNS